MSNVIFARTRHHYDSYKDYWRLVELSGYPLIYTDEIDPHSDNIYICGLLNGEWHHGWDGEVKARIIFHDLEWRLEGEYPRIPGVSEIWTSDRWYANHIGAKYVPLGSHPDLPNAPLQDCPKVWDVAMLAYMPPRRAQILHNLHEAGVTIAPNGWDMHRHEVLQQTRMMLHVHQLHNAYTVAPLRWALAAAYKMPLVSEGVHDSGIFTDKHMITADYWDVATVARDWRNNSALADYAGALHQLLCVDNTFCSFVEAAL